MRLGVNTIITLSNILQNKRFQTLNLADNAISDYGKAIKYINIIYYYLFFFIIIIIMIFILIIIYFLWF